MNKLMMQKLKKCPNCGRIPEIVVGDNFDVSIKCECGEKVEINHRDIPISVPNHLAEDFINFIINAAITYWNNIDKLN